MEDLLMDGFSRKFASYYLNLAMKEYDNPAYNREYVQWAHENGFLAESAAAYGLSDDDKQEYLSDYDFYKIWPINSWNRIWINDKLTLKYLLANTEFSDIMPKYYYYTSSKGLKKLLDAPNPNRNPSIEEFKNVLASVGEFACKPCNGTTSLGFFRMSYDGKTFFVNDEELKENEFEVFLQKHSNYVFTEYLRPSKQFEVYSPHIHTLRVVTVNIGGNNPVIIGGYLRIPNKESGEANYIIIGKENLEKFNVVVNVNYDSGEFGPAKLTYANRTVIVDSHPDNGISLHGVIDNYSELKETIIGIARRFSTVELMGFDIGITNNGIKCMEINSHPGIKYMQIFTPLLRNEYTKEYFTNKIIEIDKLSTEEKKRRNGIER